MSAHPNRIGDLVRCSIAGEVYHTYVPKPLPPVPSIDMQALYPFLDQANIALGRLDGRSQLLPDPALYLYMAIRKEAVLSSQIEGTQSSLSDLLLFENEEITGFPSQDVIEVSSYVTAIEHGLKRIQDGFPLSLRLFREIHEILLSKGRGSTKQPGQFRRSQNWIGGTRPGNAKFVPPPPEKLMDLLGQLELFLHDETIHLPALIKAGLAHHQFETLHPFLDGNGRLGRLLITLILCVDGILHEPILYLSLYFKTHRQAYYDHLQLVRDTGDWEEWLIFFLKGVIETANQAVVTSQAILSLFTADRKKIETLGKPTVSSLMVHHFLQKHPVTDSKKVAKHCHFSLPTAIHSLNHLMALGIVTEITAKARNKIYVYRAYLDLLDEGT